MLSSRSNQVISMSKSAFVKKLQHAFIRRNFSTTNQQSSVKQAASHVTPIMEYNTKIPQNKQPHYPDALSLFESMERDMNRIFNQHENAFELFNKTSVKPHNEKLPSLSRKDKIEQHTKTAAN